MKFKNYSKMNKRYSAYFIFNKISRYANIFTITSDYLRYLRKIEKIRVPNCKAKIMDIRDIYS